MSRPFEVPPHDVQTLVPVSMRGGAIIDRRNPDPIQRSVTEHAGEGLPPVAPENSEADHAKTGRARASPSR